MQKILGISRAVFPVLQRVATRSLVQQGSLSNQNEPEVTAYIAGLATPLSSTEKGLLNTLALSLKTGLGVTSLDQFFDYLNIRAGETAEQSLRNFAKRAHDSTAVNSPAHTKGEGFKGNGISSYIDIDFIPSNGVNFTLNSASYGIYFRSFNMDFLKYHGVYSSSDDGGISNSLLIGGNTFTTYAIALNSDQSSFDNYLSSGIVMLNRLLSTGYNVFLNKIKSELISTSSSKRPNQKVVELARRTADGSVGLFNTSQIAFSFCAKGMTDVQEAVVVDAFEAYMDAKGKGVIS